MADNFSVEAVLSAVDKNFKSTFEEAEKAIKGIDDSVDKAMPKASKGVNNFARTASTALGTVAGVLASKAIAAGFRAITDNVGDAVSRFDTLNQFPKIMQSWGYSAEEAEASTQRLVDGIDGLPTRLDDITGNVQNLVASGLDLDTATGVALAFNDAMLASSATTAEADRAMTQYNQMLATGKVDMQGWKSLMETMPKPLNDVAEALLGAGNNGMDLYEAIQSGEITLDQFNEKMVELANETGGFADQAKEASLGIGTSWQNIKTAIVNGIETVIRAIDDWLASNGFGGIAEQMNLFKDVIKDVFSVVAENVSDGLDILGEFVNFLQSDVGQAIVTAIGVFGGLLIVVDLINRFNTALQTAGTFMNLLASTKAFSLLAGAFAFLTSSIGLVITAIAIFIGVLVYLYNTNETVRDFINEAWTFIQELIISVVEILKERIITAWQIISEYLAIAMEFIKEVITIAWEFIREHILIVLQEIWAYVQEVWGQISTWLAENQALIQETFQVVWDAILTILTTVWENIKSLITVAMSVIVPIIQNGWNLIKDVTSTVWEFIKTLVSNAINIVLNIISLVMNIITGNWSGAWDNIKSILSSAWEIIKSLVTSAIEIVKSVIKNGLNLIKDIFSRIWETIVSTVQSKFNEVVASVKEGISKAYNAITDWFGRFRTAGSNIVSNIANGIRGAIGKVTSAMKGVLSAARNLLPFSPPKDKTSPLANIHKNGIGTQIATGIMRGQREIDRAMHNLLDMDYNLSALEVAGVSGEVHSTIQHEFGRNEANNRPIQVHLSIGGRDYTRFVSDISDEQGRQYGLEQY